MIDTSAMSDEQFQASVLDLVGREFGLGGMARFIMLNHSGRGDYTRDRHLWLGEQTLDPDEEPIAESQTKAA